MSSSISKQLKEDLEITTKPHRFWDTQPVPKLHEKPEEYGPIETRTLDEVQKTPYALPDAFEWFEVDVNSDPEMDHLFVLLEENYVEDDDEMFRFAYPVKFLRWALCPPGWRRDWHVGVRVKATQKIVAFISAVPVEMRVRTIESGLGTPAGGLRMVEINFLCVHKKLRDKRLAPLLIKEITRRVNLTDTWQAVYTAGKKIPTPVSTTTYYHRSLNPEKLVEVGFSILPPRYQKLQRPMEAFVKHYALPDRPQTPGFRPMAKKDFSAAYKLLKTTLEKYVMAPVFTEADFVHWNKTREGVVYSFVVEDPHTHEITDFASFYLIPSSIMKSPKHKVLNAAYLYYYSAEKTPINRLMTDLLVSARQLKFDVFNCLDIMQNTEFLEELKFGRGDGALHYYLFNYMCGPGLNPDQVGLTML